MFLSRAAGIAGIVLALAGPVAATAPAGAVDRAPAPSGVDLVLVLTSAPFGAVGGQPVTHTISVTGTGTGSASAVRVTFSTTIALDGASATTTQGTCSVADPRTVTCELGLVNLPGTDTAPPKVTISGTVTPGAARGALVQNLVKVASDPADADTSNNAASNAYLIPGASGAPPTHRDAAPASGESGRSPTYLVWLAVTLLALGALIIVVWRQRGRR